MNIKENLGKTVDKKIGILLCNCEGEIANKINLIKISDWLNEKHPQIITKTHNALCKKPNAIGTFIRNNNVSNIIVAACSKYKELFEEIATKAKMKPFCLETVNLLQKSALTPSSEDATEKAKIILLAAISRAKKFNGVSIENLNRTRVWSNRKMDRRSFLTFPIKHHLQIIPTINRVRCVGLRGCDICIEACPTKAISKQQKKIQIDIPKCEGCGICMVTCPARAISFPTPTLSQIDEQIRILVSANPLFLKPRIILFLCNENVSLLNKLASKGFSFPSNMLTVEVPCIGTITPLLILKTLELGAEAVAIVNCQRNCVKKYQVKDMKKNVCTSRELLKILDVDPERICTIDIVENDPKEFSAQLNVFNHHILKLGANNKKNQEPKDFKTHKNHLLSLVKKLCEKYNIKRSTRIKSKSLPFWAIEVDASKCSFCGICSKQCPTSAINLKQEEVDLKLMFDYGSCIACGICQKYCPEKAIVHENIFDLPRLYSPESVLIVDKKIKCKLCGSWFLSEKQIEHILSRVSMKSEEYSLSLSSCCPKCRLKTNLGIKNLS